MTFTAAVMPLMVVDSLAKNEHRVSPIPTVTWWNSSHALEYLTHLPLMSSLKGTDIIENNHTSFPNRQIKGVIDTTIDGITSWIEYKLANFLHKYFIYITSMPGVITNTLTIYLTTVIRPRSTTELYMFVLGVTDILVVCLRMTFNSMLVLKYAFTDAACKCFFFTANVAYLFSNWILVVWTIERCVAVLFPLKLSTLSSTRVISLTLVIVLLFIMGIMVPQITEPLSVLSLFGEYICFYSTFYYRTYAMIENCVYIYIPMFIIVTGNLTIIFKIRNLTKVGQAMTSNKDAVIKRIREHKQMTRVLITIACTFVFLHFPQILAKILEAIFPSQVELWANNYRNYFRFYVFISLGYQITDFQNSVNFFLYCAFGSKVRKAILSAVCIQQNKQRSTPSFIKTVSTM